MPRVHNLTTGASFGGFQAIVAPRPLSEYCDALRKRAVSLFGKSLCAFGVLQIGDRRLARPIALDRRFASVLPSYGVYRKIG